LGDDTQREFKVGVHAPDVPRADIETVDALANGRPRWRWLPSPQPLSDHGCALREGGR